MTNRSDLDYFAARGEAERRLSESSTDPVVAAIHAQMAICYEKLARSYGTAPDPPCGHGLTGVTRRPRRAGRPLPDRGEGSFR